MRVLGIETSCDETSAAVLADGRLRSNVVASQVDLHARYGGVVPELASRRHLERLGPVIDEALGSAGVGIGEIDAVAVTSGPGLAGALTVGVAEAKAIAFALGRPLIGVNHLEGHIYANFLTHPDVAFPALVLIVSGAHTDLVLMADHGRYEVLGRTLDDAAGEAFDKVARALGLGYPGGPAIDRVARTGRADAVKLPLPFATEASFDFSFSGLKTAVVRLLMAAPGGAAAPGPARRTGRRPRTSRRRSRRTSSRCWWQRPSGRRGGGVCVPCCWRAGWPRTRASGPGWRPRPLRLGWRAMCPPRPCAPTMPA